MATKRKKHATVLLLVHDRETTHRGETLKQALKIAEKSRLSKGCAIRWDKTRQSPAGQTAAGDGYVICGGQKREPAYFIAVRSNPRNWRRGK